MGQQPDEGARELRASRRMIQVTERELQRILLDIHDGPVQHMYAALSQLDLLRRSLEQGGATVDQPVRDRLDRIRMLLESGLGEIRAFIGAFRPPEFDARDLIRLLEGLALQHEAATDMVVELQADQDLPDVEVPVKIALYRVVQESLSNAYRHGGASRVTVRVTAPTEPAAVVRLSIEDDGAGFDPATRRTDGHFGVQGMLDRVEMVGGSFVLESAPGRGTTVRIEVPAT